MTGTKFLNNRKIFITVNFIILTNFITTEIIKFIELKKLSLCHEKRWIYRHVNNYNCVTMAKF